MAQVGRRRDDESPLGRGWCPVSAQDALSTGSAMSTTSETAAFPADVIPIQYHFNMLSDVARMGAFESAISLVVKPGMRVLELGGGTGVLSWFASRQGAAHVWCVEKLPEMAEAARLALAANEGGGRVTVVNADAENYLPPLPVDVVICEMLHTGLLRERQVQVIESFKRRYLARFGGPLPRLIPEATIQAVQPVQQDFAYHGYMAATPAFQDACSVQPRTVELGPPLVFQAFSYDEALPARCTMDGPIRIETPGVFNAVRVITKNLLAVQPAEPGPSWIMGYLVVPVAAPFPVDRGERPRVSFAYAPGAELNALTSGLRVTRQSISAPILPRRTPELAIAG